MSWLKKVGLVLVKGTQILIGIEPFVKAFAPRASDEVTLVIDKLEEVQSVIVAVEAVGAVAGLAGPDKLKAAGPLVAQVILNSSVLANRKIANETLFNQGALKIADGMADILNSLKDDVKIEDKT